MDENKRNISAKRIIAIVVIALFISGVGLPLLEQANAGTSGDRGDIISPLIPGEDQLVLTPEETAYIATSPIIKAASVDGVAPLSFTDAQGEAKGIFRSVVEQISAMSGIVFEFKLYDSVEEALNSEADIIYGISPNYAPHDMLLSPPFMTTETIIYINSSVEPHQLEDKIYAAIKGGALPEGIKPEKAIYFNTREEGLNAVEKGQADYGYGNAYSVAYYTLLNNYKNIVTVPQEKETREYCIGLLKGDEILFSIISKSISLIDSNQMETLILDVASKVDRKITFAMIMDVYAREIFIILFIVMSILLFSVISSVQANKKLRLQNRRYEVLSTISNEYLYEYKAKTDHLILSEKCRQLFENEQIFNEASRELKDFLSSHNVDDSNETIRLPLSNKETGVFKVINLRINDDSGRVDSVIGKLTDISEEAAKEKLIAKSQLDGLTGLYNAATTKELITEKIKNKGSRMDAFVLIDGDDFKDINDTHGHLVGDQALKQIARSIKQTFRKTDIIGRIGGDEFCLYLQDFPSIDYVKDKCQQLNSLLQRSTEGEPISVSVGLTLVQENDEYDDVFKRADDALYEAKQKGKAQVVVSSLV